MLCKIQSWQWNSAWSAKYLILFVLVTLCVTVDGMYVSAHPDLVSLFTRPSMQMSQGLCIHDRCDILLLLF